MAIKHYIADPASGLKAEVVEGSGEKKALVVATRPLKTFENKGLFFINNTYGVDMNQDASAGGTPDKVHDGLDSVLWTGSQVVGTGLAFDSGNQDHTTGAGQSVYFNRLDVDDVCQFAKGSDINLGNYVSITLWIYVSTNWIIGDSYSLYGYDTGTAATIGNSVLLEDYFSFNNYGVWHKLTIPLEDLGLVGTTTVDAVRIQCAANNGTKPRFYMDDIQFEQTGTPLEFRVSPGKGTWLHVEDWTLSFAAAGSAFATVAGATENATMPGLAYNNILGVTLVGGVTYRRVKANIVIASATVKSLIELLSLSQSAITGQGSDGTNYWVTIRLEHKEPIILKSESTDYMSFTISEDLTGFKHFRIFAGCREEIR